MDADVDTDTGVEPTGNQSANLMRCRHRCEYIAEGFSLSSSAITRTHMMFYLDHASASVSHLHLYLFYLHAMYKQLLGCFADRRHWFARSESHENLSAVGL